MAVSNSPIFKEHDDSLRLTADDLQNLNNGQTILIQSSSGQTVKIHPTPVW